MDVAVLYSKIIDVGITNPCQLPCLSLSLSCPFVLCIFNARQLLVLMPCCPAVMIL